MHVELYDQIFTNDYLLTYAGEGDCRNEPHGEEVGEAVTGQTTCCGRSTLSHGDGAG